MRGRFVQRVRDVARRRVPGAARAHRTYVRWAYSARPAARTKLFQSIIRDNRWGDAGYSLEQTQVIRKELPRLWNELGVRRLADVPCGDLSWMSLIVDELEYYFGGDIVPELVAAARERAPDLCEFSVFDLLTDDFPSVDAVLIRDALVVLSDRNVLAVLRNVQRSSARYLITTTYPEKPPQDIVTGDWRPLNLCVPPFSLPEPIRLINENCTRPVNCADKSLGVWEVGSLETVLGPAAGRRR